MYSFSDNFRLRQYYLQEQQVSTQCGIKQRITLNLAAALFKFKVLVGLEPPLKRGRRDGYVCPKEILFENRAVLKPLAHEILNKINHFGIEHLGFQILIAYYKDHPKVMLQESKNACKNTVEPFRQEQCNKNVNLQTPNNTDHINSVFDLFSAIYRTSLNNIEMVFHKALINDIKRSVEETVLRMKSRYGFLCKSQAFLITHEATVKLKKEKARLKAKFIENLETCRTEMTNRLHDLNVDKRITAEKLRSFLEYQKLARQIYGYLKEECINEMEKKNQQQKKYIKQLTSLTEQKERKVVKNFQMFVSYCLYMLPDHAEVFINMEKLALLQFSEVLENPTAGSIIGVEEKRINTPVPQPKPFYLFRDRGYKAQVAQDLCPKLSDTSSASGLPVIVVNKGSLYTACDNFERFNNKAKELIHGNRGDDADIEDDLVYENFVPVKYTTSQKLSETNIKSSLLQILLQKKSKTKKELLAAHDIPHCFCTFSENSKKTIKPREKSTEQRVPLVQSQFTNNTAGTSANINRLEHAREPKLEKYLRETEPKACGCAKSSKKHLVEHVPVYMRTASKFDALELANYETCSTTALKELVKRARGQRDASPIVPISKTKDMSTQYSEDQTNFLCTCNKDSFEQVRTDRFSLENVSPSYMKATPSSFAGDKAHSLRQLIEDARDLIEKCYVKEKRCHYSTRSDRRNV